MPTEIVNFLVKFLIVPLVLSLILSIYYWKRLPIAFKFLSFYLCCNLLVEVIVFFLPSGTNNLPLLHIYTLFEFILITLLYQKMNLFESWRAWRFEILLISISSLIVLNSIFKQSIYIYNSYAKTVVQVLFIAYAVGYMFQLKENNKESASLNLMNYAILIAYSGSLFVFMFGNVLLADAFYDLFWDINLVLNLLFQILILISIWKASRFKKLQF